MQIAIPTPLKRRKAFPRLGQGILANAALVLSCVIWGTAFAFGKLALLELTVSQLVLLRFGLASLALVPVIIRRRAWIAAKDISLFLITGFLAVPVTFLLQFQGLALTTVSRASLIIGAIPPLLALGAALFLGEKAGWRGWAAISASVVGVLVVTGSPGDGGSWRGDILVFLSAFVSAIWVLMNKRLSETYGSLTATTYLLFFGTLTLFPFTLLSDGLPPLSLTPRVWGSVAILGIFCTALAFALWNWGLERVPASSAGVYLNLEPLVGTLLGITLWKETLTPGMILGGALILGAAGIAAQLNANP